MYEAGVTGAQERTPKLLLHILVSLASYVIA